MTEMFKRVASVTADVLGDELASAQLTGATTIPLVNSGDFYEDGGSVLIDGTVYTYSAVEEGEDDDAPAPSITLDSGLTDDLPIGTPVEVWNPDTGAVVVDYLVEVTDDTDASPATAYLRHDLIPLLPEGLPPGVGDSVTVEVDNFGNWIVTNIHGRRAVMEVTLTTDAPDRPRVEIGQGRTFGFPAEEVRIYTEHADEIAPAEITVVTAESASGPSDGQYATLVISTTEWDTPLSDVPSLSLTTGTTGGASNSSAILAAQLISLVVGAGGAGVAGGPFHATMGAGSVGTSTFRDSVDARVTAGVPAASETVAGRVELATTAETTTGTDTTRATHPAGVKAVADTKRSLRRTINDQTGTTYTLVLTDEDKVIQLNNAGAITVTVPDNASVAFPVGTDIELVQTGVGGVTFTPGASTTINSRGGLLSISARYGSVRLRKRSANQWVLSGDLA